MMTKKLYFDEKKHKYTYGHTPNDGEVFISATTLIELFKNKFDGEYWSLYVALRDCLGYTEETKKKFSAFLIKNHQFDFNVQHKEKLFNIAAMSGVTRETLIAAQISNKEMWKIGNKKSTDKGTAFHNHVENKQITDGGTVHEGVFVKSIQELPDDITDIHKEQQDVSVPELRLFNVEYGIAGTIDQAFVFENKEFDINDWKTNKKIDLTNKYQKMKYPLNHLDDCSYNHYCLQISIYAWMLEQFGFTPRSLKFTHVVIDDHQNVISSTVYVIHYMKQEVVNMLNYYKVNKKDLLNGR